VSVAIVDYGSGNLHSVAKAFERAARESGHDAPILVTRDPEVVRRAERVVLPGVGAFADCRRGLDAVPCASRAGRFSASALACSSWPTAGGNTR
jgi:imidazole glycerol-phosphate synthase subunit HisH